jgi:GT2 family glycosyltransferase
VLEGSVTPKPTISVVVLSYNRPDYLAQSLRSVVSQDDGGMDITVVDNRSPKSEEVAQVVAGFPDVRLLAMPSNTGFASGMNAGLQQATGDYVHLTEDDIVLEDGFYAAMLACAEAFGPSVLATGLIAHADGEGHFFAGAELDFRPTLVYRLRPPETLDRPFRTGMVVGAMVFGRRETFVRVGPFRLCRLAEGIVLGSIGHFAILLPRSFA